MSGNTLSYDSLDRLTTKAAPAGILSYSYDGAGNLASTGSNHSNDVLVAYAYDELNRLTTVTDSRLTGNQTTTYTYDPASNVATVTAPNGLQTTLSYDSLNRLTSLTTPISSYTYTLGSTGNCTGVVEGNGRTIAWNYDGIYRLTNETIGSDPSNSNGSAAYGLDPVGNRLSLNSSLPGIASGSYGYNADDEVSSETYDLNGNALTASGKTFSYNSENHLTSMNGGQVTLVYDGDGNRVAKTVNGVTTRYLVDDLNPTGYPQVVEELVGGVVTRQYTYGLQRISENQVVSNTWTASFYGYDGGGNVRNLANASGAVTDTYEYDAYGNALTTTGTTPNVYLYRGEQYDSDLGLYYLRARYYNPATGRFISRDPLDGEPNDPATSRVYDYAESDPLDLADPTGQKVQVKPAESEYTGLVIKVDFGTLTSVAAVGCAVRIGYNVLALKIASTEDIRLTANCKAKGLSRMKLQLQRGSPMTGGITVEQATRTMVAQDPPGVSLRRVNTELDELRSQIEGGMPGFPRSALRGLDSAIDQVKSCAARYPSLGISLPQQNFCQGYFTSDKRSWRIDLDNDAGWNLRE